MTPTQQYPYGRYIFSQGESRLETSWLKQFDLILTDIYMEGIGGVETVRRIRQLDADTLIAFTTTSRGFLKKAKDAWEGWLSHQIPQGWIP